MTGRFSGWNGKAVVGTVLMVCAFLHSTPAQEPRQAPLAGPSGSYTNAVRLNRLQRLEDELTHVLKDLFRGNSMEAVATPRTARPAMHATTPREQEKENKYDWTLSNPKDFGMEQDTDDPRKMFEDDGNAGNKKLSPRDQFLKDFLQQDSKPQDFKKEPSPNSIFGWQDPSQKEGNTPAEVQKSEENLRKLLQERKSDSYSAFSPLRSLGEALGGPATDFSNSARRENSPAEEYRKWIAPQAARPGNDLVSSALAAATRPSQASVSLPSLNAVNHPKRDLLGPQFGSINPVLTPTRPIDVTTAVLNQWDPLYTPPVIEAPRRSYAPPKPNFEAPRRKF